jgi:hypothetical protein
VLKKIAVDRIGTLLYFLKQKVTNFICGTVPTLKLFVSHVEF